MSSLLVSDVDRCLHSKLVRFVCLLAGARMLSILLRTCMTNTQCCRQQIIRYDAHMQPGVASHWRRSLHEHTFDTSHISSDDITIPSGNCLQSEGAPQIERSHQKLQAAKCVFTKPAHQKQPDTISHPRFRSLPSAVLAPAHFCSPRPARKTLVPLTHTWPLGTSAPGCSRTQNAA